MSLRRQFRTPAEARRLAAALQADQPDHLTRRIRGRVLELQFSAPTPESARATGDDLLACLSAAERTGDVSPKRRPGPARAPPSDP